MLNFKKINTPLGQSTDCANDNIISINREILLFIIIYGVVSGGCILGK